MCPAVVCMCMRDCWVCGPMKLSLSNIWFCVIDVLLGCCYCSCFMKDGCTVLLLAVKKGYEAIVRLLVENGANLEVLNDVNISQSLTIVVLAIIFVHTTQYFFSVQLERDFMRKFVFCFMFVCCDVDFCVFIVFIICI